MHRSIPFGGDYIAGRVDDPGQLRRAELCMNEWAEFRHFLYLLTVLECGGIRPAAEVLHTYSPNLSVQAKDFQEYFNICLYEICADKRLSPTRAGTALAPMARGLLRARDKVIAAVVVLAFGRVRNEPCR